LVRAVNDYSMGALEALSWVRAVLRKCRKLEEFQVAEEEVNGMVLRLASGAAVSFRDKAALIEEI
jgi:hypothetical protein